MMKDDENLREYLTRFIGAMFHLLPVTGLDATAIFTTPGDFRRWITTRAANYADILIFAYLNIRTGFVSIDFWRDYEVGNQR